MKVIVPTQLRGYTHGEKEVHAAGATLRDVFVDLERQFPGFRFRVIDEQDRVRPHILIFIGGERCEDIATPVGEAEVFIAGALSGG